MGLLNLRRIGPLAYLVAVAFVLVFASLAAAQTPIRFSLDGRLEGPEALALLPQDKGYFKSEGLDVTVDEAASPLEPITRVATGGYDIAFADINALIRYRDQHPSPPVKAVHGIQQAALRRRDAQEPWRHRAPAARGQTGAPPPAPRGRCFASSTASTCRGDH
jgi:ABC-type nitrate/sulfonate/bicarbonate transport system substrate-binding protein